MISCKQYAAIIKQALKDDYKNFGLDIIRVGKDPGAESYSRGKIKDCTEIGMKVHEHIFPENISEKELISSIIKIAKNKNGIIFALPAPPHLNPKRIMAAAIKPFQDIDGMVFDTYTPCTPKGIIDWLLYNNINLEGKNVVIIGRSQIVGKPLARIMLRKNATVSICHSHTDLDTIQSLCSLADIVVVAVGKPAWFDFNLKNAPLIIDVGINYKNNKLIGDVDPNGNYNVTPVPGGVGLLTRAALLTNLRICYLSQVLKE